MKIVKSCTTQLILWTALLLFMESVSAQNRTQTRGRRASNISQTNTRTNDATQSQVLDATITGVPVDTNAPAKVETPDIKTPPKDPFGLDSVRPSQRLDGMFKSELNLGRIPLDYEHIREDDAFYKARVWRVIDIREKMNQPFRYRSEDDNGSSMFINILLKAIKDGQATPFNASVDDRFTTVMSINEVQRILTGEPDTIYVTSAVTGQRVPKVVPKEFNPDDIVKYMIKEDWVFDKESSRMFVRILGIAPMKQYYDQTSGLPLGEPSPIFWLYYPEDLRPVLSKYEIYNPKNGGNRLTWEDLLESRYFASTIIKSSLDNPSNKFIFEFIQPEILRLLEGDAIKSKIFNFEQDLWSF